MKDESGPKGMELSCIINSTDDAVYTKNLDGTITSWNPGAEQMFGWKAEEIIGKNVNVIIPKDLLGQEERIIWQLRAGHKVHHFETERLTKEGQRIYVSLNISPLHDENGSVVGAANITRNITRQKRSEYRLRENEKLAAVGRLAATVAHEINNPLEAVTNLCWLAKHHPGTPAEVVQYLETADEELKRIAGITRQTLGFYREKKDIAQVRVSTVIEQLLAVLARKIENKHIHFNITARETHEVMAVSGELRQLFMNLLTNSIDAVSIGGDIKVRITTGKNFRTGETGVRVTILDNGSGITEPVKKHIFEPFYTTKKDFGTGLGLWVCKGIVDDLKGEISVHSNGKNWTAISIFLPGVPEMVLQEAA